MLGGFLIYWNFVSDIFQESLWARGYFQPTKWQEIRKLSPCLSENCSIHQKTVSETNLIRSGTHLRDIILIFMSKRVKLFDVETLKELIDLGNIVVHFGLIADCPAAVRAMDGFHVVHQAQCPNQKEEKNRILSWRLFRPLLRLMVDLYRLESRVNLCRDSTTTKLD